MSYAFDAIENIGISAAALILCLFCLWLISLKVRDASLIDIFWGAGFGIVALICLLLAELKTPYTYLLAALPIIWAVRLSLYLAARNLGHGEDPRYVAMRKRAAKKGMSEMAWRKRAFFTIYLGQGILIMIVSAPVLFGMAAGQFRYPESQPLAYDLHEIQIGFLAFMGVALWAIGFLFEAVGDLQLKAFLKKMGRYDGAYEDKPVLDTGLWKYTRHPNYFGNACMWWGIWLVACEAPMGWMTVFAPLLMTFLLTRVSGRDLLERKLKKRPAYRDYAARTSGFVPWFPKKS